MICYPFYLLLDSLCASFVDFCMRRCSCAILAFFSGNAFTWFWHQGNEGLIESVRKCSLLLIFLEYFMWSFYHFLIKCLVKFTHEAIWAWVSSLGRFYQKIQSTIYKNTQVIKVLLEWALMFKFSSFKELDYFI